MPIPNTPPPSIVIFEPYADCEPMECRPEGLRETARLKRYVAAKMLAEAFLLEAQAAEAELAGTPWRRPKAD